MVSVKVKAKVVDDSSGVYTEIPILLTEHGEISSLTDYLLERRLNGASRATLDKTIHSVVLFLEYLDANSEAFDKPESVLNAFLSRLYSGTVSNDGIDPSGLYWSPRSTLNAKNHMNRLTNFTDWLSQKNMRAPLNPVRKATSHEEKLHFTAWWHRTHNDFLGHLKDKYINRHTKSTPFLKGMSPLSYNDNDAIAFPSKKFKSFFIDGVGNAKDPRVALRDQLIILLMHGAGLRLSEALTLWVTDVFEDPVDTSKSIVRIYDERDGLAPNGWKDRNGNMTRRAYLRENYGRLPRRDMTSTQHVGWKSSVVDHKDGYLSVHWFPTDFSKLFMMLWKVYLKYRATSCCEHPYAFINFDSRFNGNLYTSNAFNRNYAAALRRIGLEPNRAQGLSPHGHRHNYGRRLFEANIDPLIRKKCLHHKSIESQVVYTLPGNKLISEMLTAASNQLSMSEHNVELNPDWSALVRYGFDDIDPNGYFTGVSPILGK